MAKKIVVTGFREAGMAQAIAGALSANFSELVIRVEDTTPEEDAEVLRSVMLAGPDEMFGRSGS